MIAEGMVGTARSSKGFLVEAADAPRPLLCRDVRGFPGLVEASGDGSVAAPDRCVIVVPDVAMDDWLSRWAEDAARVRRSVSITRRIDGRQVRFSGTLLAYGSGVETIVRVERVERWT
jgi:hypothetical protein